jgi:hypothetical protein
VSANARRRTIPVLTLVVLAAGCGVIPGMRGRGPAPPRGDYEVLLRSASQSDLRTWHVVEVAAFTVEGEGAVPEASAERVRSALVREIGAMAQVRSVTPVPRFVREQPASKTMVFTGNVVEKTGLGEDGARLSVRVRCLDKATGRVLLEALLHGSAGSGSDADCAAGVGRAAARMMERTGDWKR